jgi:hypothetical protein
MAFSGATRTTHPGNSLLGLDRWKVLRLDMRHDDNTVFSFMDQQSFNEGDIGYSVRHGMEGGKHTNGVHTRRQLDRRR